MATDRTHPGLKVTEAQWMAQVIELAELHSWRVMHVRPAIARQSARHGTKWVTATSVTGWVDLTLWHPTAGGVIFAELKTDRGRLTREQADVIDSLRGSGQEVHVWRPRDFDAVHERLTRHRPHLEATRAL